MGRGPADADGGGTRPSGVRRTRRLAVAGLAGTMVLLVVIAVLATRLASVSGTAPAAATTASPTPSAATSLSVSAIYQRVEPSMVFVRAGKKFGSGVIVDDNGTILTADHVVAGGGSITVTFADGTTASATVSSADTKTDIAVLRPAKLPQVVVAASLGGNAAVGAPVIAIGNPLGLTDSVTAGVVSGLDRSASTDAGQRSGLIQFDAAVNPGSSGGPLLSSGGTVIGIVVAIADPDGEDAFAGIGFAIPIGAALGSGSGSGGSGPQI